MARQRKLSPERKGEFEPQVVQKNQTDISNIEDQVLSMHECNLPTNQFCCPD